MKSETFNETYSGTLPKVSSKQSKVLECVLEGVTTAPSIKKVTGLPKTTVWRCLKALLNRSLVQKSGISPALYSVTGMGRVYLTNKNKSISKGKVPLFSLRGNKKKKRIHDLTLKFPLLRYEPVAGFTWDKINKEFKNDHQNYLYLNDFGVTLKKTSKSIITYFHRKELDSSRFITESLNWVLKTSLLIASYLKNYGIVVDLYDVKVIQQHIATNAKEFEEGADPRITAKLDIGRKAKSYFKTNLNAQAWIDRSEGDLELESNDLLYEEKLIRMPEVVHDLNIRQERFEFNIDLYNQNIELHLEVMNEMKKTLKDISRSVKK